MKTLDKFLPIGTIILLKQAEKKLMITGFCSVDGENNGKLYDYCGCLYPEGILTADETYLFNHDEIEEIVFLGYDSEEEQNFKKELKEYLEKEVEGN